jgi:hypothetical protein
MPLFNSQAMGTAVLVALLTVVAIAFTVVAIGFAIERYVEWSSEAAMAVFMVAPSASDGRTGCPVGKRKLPTQLPTAPP